jgi:tRNA A-37 threonylcarbamoyl transferase component Bud32
VSTRPPPTDPRIGSSVAGKYRIERLIGSGGMGSVYEAENVALGKRVALKFLHMSAQQDETSLARFQREARAICAVESGHIVQVFDWGQDEAGQPFLVMELLSGRDLAQRISYQGVLQVTDAVRFAIEALRGLRKVHAAGIVHRDLKPENLFLVTGDDDELHVKIVDFGLSKLVDQPEGLAGPGFEQSARLTQQGAVVGTPLYMAPEQIEAIVEVDQRVDIWAMGAILHEMLAGSPPFMDRSYARLVMAICQRDPPDLSKLNPQVPPELARAVAAAMTRDRDQRLQSADAFIDALGVVRPELRTSVIGAPTDVSVASQTMPAADRGFGADAPGSGVSHMRAAGRAMMLPGSQLPAGPTPGSGRTVATPAGAPPLAAPAGSIGTSPTDVADATADGPSGGVASGPAASAAAASAPGTLPSGAAGDASLSTSSSNAGPLDATIAAHTRGAATVWLADAPVFSMWRGEVDSPDRLRIEARDGSVRDLRLEPVGELRLGRVEHVGSERNELVYPDVASRLAARLTHDGVRWWLQRREECSVPVQVGTRALARGEGAPVVHGTFVTVGAMRATMVDRRYVSRSVPAGTVDPASGLLARGGLEQELATALQQRDPYGVALLLLAPDRERADNPIGVRVAVGLHKTWPSAVGWRARRPTPVASSSSPPTPSKPPRAPAGRRARWSTCVPCAIASA